MTKRFFTKERLEEIAAGVEERLKLRFDVLFSAECKDEYKIQQLASIIQETSKLIQLTQQINNTND